MIENPNIKIPGRGWQRGYLELPLTFVNTDSYVYHLSTKQELELGKIAGIISHQSLETEGFVHCCLKHQLKGVLDRYFLGREDLMLLTLDPALLNVPMQFENTVGGQELFPHIYGPINLVAVVSVEDFGLDKINEFLQRGS